MLHNFNRAARLHRPGIVVLCLAALLGRAAIGQNPPKSQKTPPPALVGPAAPKPAKDAPAKPMGGFEGAEVNMNAKTGITTANAFTYTEKDTTVKGDKGRYNKNTGQLAAQGNLVMDDPQHHVTGNKADVDNKNKIAIITENVVMIVKPAPDKSAVKPDATVGSERKQGIVITCDYVKDYYKRKFTILRGHLVFRQKITKKDGSTLERVLTADHAEYNGATDKMKLFTPVKGHDSDGQTTDFEKDVLLGTKEGEETLETKGRTKAVFIIDDSDSGGEGEAPPQENESK